MFFFSRSAEFDGKGFEESIGKVKLPSSTFSFGLIFISLFSFFYSRQRYCFRGGCIRRLMPKLNRGEVPQTARSQNG